MAWLSVPWRLLRGEVGMPQEGGWRGGKAPGEEGRVGGACQLAGSGWQRAGVPSNSPWTWGEHSAGDESWRVTEKLPVGGVH